MANFESFIAEQYFYAFYAVERAYARRFVNEEKTPCDAILHGYYLSLIFLYADPSLDTIAPQSLGMIGGENTWAERL